MRWANVREVNVKKRIAIVAVSLFAAGLVPAAQANWGGESDCNGKAAPENEHCYAGTTWEPNVHKNIRDVWSYVTAEDARFSPLGSPSGFENFTTMESWMSWSIPGTTVEEPESEEKWVEGGEEYPGQGECHPFWAAEFGEHNPNYVGEEEQFPREFSEELCASKVHQLFKFVKNASSGEVCVSYDENLLRCTPASALPSGPFTDVESGNEIAEHNEPLGIKGHIESFAEGGIDNRWHGLKRASLHREPEATCVGGDSEGTVEFSAGKDDCNPPKRCEPRRCLEENEEPYRGASIHARGARRRAKEADTSIGGEEGSGTTETSDEPPPVSDFDAFAGYQAPTGNGPGTTEIEHKALERPEFHKDEWTGEAFERNVTYSTTVSTGRAIGDAEVNEDEFIIPEADLTAGQKRYEETKVDIVELTGKYRGITTESPDISFGGVAAVVTHINLVYDAVTGELLRRTWGNQETPLEHKHRKERKAEESARKKAEAYENRGIRQCERGGKCRSKSMRCMARREGCTAEELCKQDFIEDCVTPKEVCDYTSLECIHATECRLEGEGCTLEERCYAYKEIAECEKKKADSDKEKCDLLSEEEYEQYYCFNRVKQLEATQSDEDERHVYPPEGPPQEAAELPTPRFTLRWSDAEYPHDTGIGENTTLERAPAIIEVTVTTRSMHLPRALVVVGRDGKMVITGTRNRRIRLKPGVYEVTARASRYKCDSKTVQAIGNRYCLVHIVCSR
jgi:hypothetical protein